MYVVSANSSTDVSMITYAHTNIHVTIYTNRNAHIDTSIGRHIGTSISESIGAKSQIEV